MARDRKAEVADDDAMGAARGRGRGAVLDEDVVGLARFDGRAALTAWINMCAARLALHALRGERNQREIASDWSDTLAALPAMDPVVEALRERHAVGSPTRFAKPVSACRVAIAPSCACCSCRAPASTKRR